MTVNIRRYLGGALVLSAVGASGASFAGGFYVQEQSAAGVGRAQAGNVAISDDSSTAYFNPAGLTELDGIQVAQGIDLVLPTIQLTDTGSRNRTTGAFLASPASGGFAPANGSDGGNPGSATPIPNFSLSVPIPETPLTFGLALSAPFGSATKYTNDSFARYDSIDTFLFTLDIAPTIAWKVNDWLSLGAGLDEQYAYVKLRSALPNPLVPGGPTPATDGRSTLTGHTWSTGFNLGLLLKPTDTTKVGLTYRYGITHNIKGSATVSGLSGPLAAGNGQFAATAPLDLPDTVSVGLSQKLSPEFTLLGQIDWFNWSKFQAIAVTLANGSKQVTAENYKDTVSFSVGGEYQLTDSFRLRGGLKYDPTPTGDQFRDTRVPDGDRYWLSGGFHYAWSDTLGVDVGYSHIFVQDSTVNLTRGFYATAPFPIPTVSTIKATSAISFDILAVGLTSRF